MDIKEIINIVCEAKGDKQVVEKAYQEIFEKCWEEINDLALDYGEDAETDDEMDAQWEMARDEFFDSVYCGNIVNKQLEKFGIESLELLGEDASDEFYTYIEHRLMDEIS